MPIYTLIYSILINKLKRFKEYINNNLIKKWIREFIFQITNPII